MNSRNNASLLANDRNKDVWTFTLSYLQELLNLTAIVDLWFESTEKITKNQRKIPR